jgi:hypothetical protein
MTTDQNIRRQIRLDSEDIVYNICRSEVGLRIGTSEGMDCT